MEGGKDMNRKQKAGKRKFIVVGAALILLCAAGILYFHKSAHNSILSQMKITDISEIEKAVVYQNVSDGGKDAELDIGCGDIAKDNDSKKKFYEILKRAKRKDKKASIISVNGTALKHPYIKVSLKNGTDVKVQWSFPSNKLSVDNIDYLLETEDCNELYKLCTVAQNGNEQGTINTQ